MLSSTLRLSICLLLVLLLASCQWMHKRQLDKQYGDAQPVSRQLAQKQNSPETPARAGKHALVKSQSHQQYAAQSTDAAKVSGNKADIKNAQMPVVKKVDERGEKPYLSAQKQSQTQQEVLYEQAQAVLNQRCVVCHACYDAPCQLKLGSPEGLDRGASPEKVYYGQRLVAAQPTRLFIDADNAEQWRKKGFHPVLNEREQSPETNLQLSVLYQLLKQKQDNPLPNDKHLDEKIFTLSLNRSQSCPKVEGLPSYQKDHPLWGMPYGLPAISEQEFSVVGRWVANGSRYQKKPLSQSVQQKVQHWEAFFNGESLKAQLVNRYLYEHLFLANLYFPETDAPDQFFKLVRSRTAPGKPIDIIATRRVYDDPQGPVYYRLQAVTEAIVNKTHQPYRLDSQREEFWQEIFYQTDYQVTAAVGYQPEKSSNPFMVFEQLPVQSRYRFLLDEAQYSIMNFIKGPVCRGQVALDVIQDHFWVVFLSPEITNESTTAYLEEHAELLRFPAHWQSNGGVLAWYDLAKRQKQYLKEKVAYYNLHIDSDIKLDQELIWNGDQGKNDNAALTVFRHFNSATVVKGFAGNNPKTTWVINYPLLERIHYLLVAGFDVYGNLIHQLNTRLYMDFLRMEGEANFIAFLPKAQRHAAFEQWYVGAEDKVSEYFDLMLKSLEKGSDVAFPKGNSVRQNIEQLQARLAKRTAAKRWSFDGYPEVIRRQAAKVDAMQGQTLHILPQMAFIRVQDGDKQHWLTLLHHNAHKNMTRVFTEKDAWWPERDTASLLPGFVGAYPNVFFHLDIHDLPIFVGRIGQLKDEQSYQALVDDYGIRRTDANFWAFSDAMHKAFKKQAGINYGLMDFNRYENR